MSRLIFSGLWIVALLVPGINACKTTHQQPVQNYKESADLSTFRVMFYNTENLYDIEDDPLTNDSEFLPEGANKWSYYRYNEKLQKIAKVIVAVGEAEGNGLVGLCEIENRKVLVDLIRNTPLSASGLEILHRDSKDPRGSDVALLYKKSSFRLLYYNFLEFGAPGDSSRSRDILYARGIVKNTDTLHVFVNHWPSRRGGKEQSDSRRNISASILKASVDSILKNNINACIIIMGDFNDEPTDKSIYAVLQAKDSLQLNNKVLFNYMYANKIKGAGSYKYQSEWNMLDQFMGSYALVNRIGNLQAGYHAAHIYAADWIMEDDSKFPGKKPFRTFAGPRYLGGYSDHLPVYLDIRVVQKGK